MVSSTEYLVCSDVFSSESGCADTLYQGYSARSSILHSLAPPLSCHTHYRYVEYLCTGIERDQKTHVVAYYSTTILHHLCLRSFIDAAVSSNAQQ